jgi:hypothetical protein
LRKEDFARKNKPGEKAQTKLVKTFAKNLEADFGDLTLQEITFAAKTGLRKMKPFAYQNSD